MNVPWVPDGPGPCLFVKKNGKQVRLIRWSIGAASAWGETHIRDTTLQAQTQCCMDQGGRHRTSHTT